MSEAAWGSHRPSALARTLIGLSRHSVFGRGRLRRRVTQPLFERLHCGPVDCTLWGSPVRLWPAHNRSDRKALLRPDHLDRRELRFLASRMAKDEAVFVDVGANSGFYSLYAAMHAGEDARIFAAEPAAPVLDRLVFNFALARQAGRINKSTRLLLINAAIGDWDGEALLSVSGSDGGRTLRTTTGERVQVRPLATALSDRGLYHADVLKIDVEGFEDRILPPYLRAIPPAHFPGAIIIEHVSRADWRVDCIDDCLDRGYRVLFTTQANTVLVRA